MQPAATPASGLELLLFLGIVAIWPAVWRFIAKRQVGFGKGRFVAHLIGATAGFCVSFTLFLAWIAIVGNIGGFAVVIFAAMTAWGIRVWSLPPQAKAEPKAKPVKLTAASQISAQTQPLPSPGPTEAELATIEAARRQSIDASKRAGKSRKKDMLARGEKPAERVWAKEFREDWEEEVDVEADEFRIPQVAFTKIEFDYYDAKGDRSHRSVDVWAVDDEYFEGHCHKAHDTRTFVIGRIRGKVTVHDTGEILTPSQWAAQAHQDPLNTGHVQGRPSPPWSPKK